MPGMSGPELQLELRRLGRDIPIVFITANTDEVLRPTVMKRGAVALLRKPFSEEALLKAVNAALELGEDLPCN
jgi:FixJ family two-component response regulator